MSAESDKNNNFKKLNVTEFMDKFGFSVALAVMASPATSSEKIADYVLAGLLTVFSIILLFEKLCIKKRWLVIVSWSKLDIAHLSFGLGLLTSSSQISHITWVNNIFALIGAGFAAYGIGMLIGKSLGQVLENNAKVGIALGAIITLSGVFDFIKNWILIKNYVFPYIDRPILLMLIGIYTIVLSILIVRIEKIMEEK